MKTIYKYPLSIDKKIIKLPSGWEILTVQNQGGVLTMWAIVESENKEVDVWIAIYGTGHPLPNINQQYLATIQMDNGLVWHLFLVY